MQVKSFACRSREPRLRTTHDHSARVHAHTPHALRRPYGDVSAASAGFRVHTVHLRHEATGHSLGARWCGAQQRCRTAK
eukprot:805462-Prymnesium_polylepis.1